MRPFSYTSLAALIMALALLSCAKPEDVRQAIEAASTEFAEAFNRGDAAAVAALYTEDAKVLPPNSEMVDGKQAIQEFWSGAMEMGIRDFALKTVDVGFNDDLAYEMGTYTLNIQPEGGQATTDTGKYVVVWTRQGDGSWKLAVDIWNSNAPPPAQ
ncbi:MAG: YybH family protein [Anaerolineae bacterium]